MDFCGNVDCQITISDHNKTFFQNSQIGKKLDDHFDIIGMIEEAEELEQEEALQTPPDQMEGREFEEDVWKKWVQSRRHLTPGKARKGLSLSENVQNITNSYV